MPALMQQQRRMTAEELAGPGVPEKFVELIEGELIEMTPAGWRRSEVAYNVARVFDRFCEEHSDIRFCAENNGFHISRDPDTVLSPDAAMFRRRPTSKSPWYEFSPEVVVEVLSPSNTPLAMAFKRHRYFEAGTEQFWLVDVGARKIDFYFGDGRVLSVTGDETIQGEGFAAGMGIDLKEVFRER